MSQDHRLVPAISRYGTPTKYVVPPRTAYPSIYGTPIPPPISHHHRPHRPHHPHIPHQQTHHHQINSRLLLNRSHVVPMGRTPPLLAATIQRRPDARPFPRQQPLPRTLFNTGNQLIAPNVPNHAHNSHRHPRVNGIVYRTPSIRTMTHLQVVLRKPSVTMPWGMTISLFDDAFIVIGHLKREIVDPCTVFARNVPHNATAHLQTPLQLHCGDIVLALNEMPIDSFESFESMRKFLQQNTSLTLLIARDTSLPHFLKFPSLQESFDTAEQVYTTIKPLLKALSSGLGRDFYQPQKSKQLAAKKAHIEMTWAQARPRPVLFRNQLFRGEDGKFLQFDDDLEPIGDDGERAHMFLPKIESFADWLQMRKNKWRKTWQVHEIDKEPQECDVDDDNESGESTVSKDFWTHQGYASFEDWIACKTHDWKKTYSWNQRKRKRIEQELEEVVHFPSCHDTEQQLQDWLRVRKTQWRIMRRKRHCQKAIGDRVEEEAAEGNDDVSETRPTFNAPPVPMTPRQTSVDMAHIDALLEEKRAREQKRKERQATYDLSPFFDAQYGIPDDVISYTLQFLHPSEHGKLLCVNKTTSDAIKDRDDMWRSLCPKRWALPRRPRKRWHDLYISKMRKEEAAFRKQSDDLLTKAATILFKGDHLHKIEKLVKNGEKKFAYNVDYNSGVVCERNSMLNLAAINGRIKVVKWLIDTKGADIETCDRGSFTPLLNAAWNGNKNLVRFLLAKGCDRSKIGTGHYTCALAPPDFKGLNAEGWARKRGHLEVAELIRAGLC